MQTIGLAQWTADFAELPVSGCFMTAGQFHREVAVELADAAASCYGLGLPWECQQLDGSGIAASTTYG